MNNRVVITGMGIVSPIGIGIQEFSKSIYEGHSNVVFSEQLRKLGINCQIGSFVDLGNKKNLFAELKQFHLSRSSEFVLLALIETINNANLSNKILPYKSVDYDTGLILGSLAGQSDYIEFMIDKMKLMELSRVRSSIAEQIMFSGVTALMSGIFGFGNCAISSSMACASSTHTIVDSFNRIKYGEAKMIFAGGYEIFNPHVWAMFDTLNISTRNFNNDPKKASCPMSIYASGFVPSEGAGILLLENLANAQKRNAKILAEVIGAHTNAGGQRNGGTMSAPSSEGVIKCIKDCVTRSGIQNSEIDYINGHLTSTMADILEIKNLITALSRKGKEFPIINSLKSITGHAIGAAGAMETIAGIIQMNDSFIHPNLNCKDIHPEILSEIDSQKIPARVMKNINIDCFLKTSFGFGDVNSCLIIKKWKE